jgi:hypothetical protein
MVIRLLLIYTLNSTTGYCFLVIGIMSSIQPAASEGVVKVPIGSTTAKGIRQLPSAIFHLILSHLEQEELFSLYSTGLVLEMLLALPDRIRVPRGLMVEMLRHELKITAPSNAQLVIMSSMCRDCTRYISEPRMLVCKKCMRQCNDCGKIGAPTVWIANCKNSQRYLTRGNMYGADDEDSDFEGSEDGIDCCWKWVCRDGCLFTCQTVITTSNSSAIAPTPGTGALCGNELFSPFKERARSVAFACLVEQNTDSTYHCMECADAVMKSAAALLERGDAVFQNARTWSEHCKRCHLPYCDATDECPGCCEDCGSATNKLRWVPACTSTLPMWRPKMTMRELPDEGHWKRVCWGSCRWTCSICDSEIVTRGLLNPRGTSLIYSNQVIHAKPSASEQIVLRRQPDAEGDDPVYICWYCSPTIPANQLLPVHTWYACRTSTELWQHLRQNLHQVLELRETSR